MTCRDTRLPEKVGQGSAVRNSLSRLYPYVFLAGFRLVSCQVVSLTCCAPRPKMRLFRIVPVHRGFRPEGP
jgi:hypothetical protein